MSGPPLKGVNFAHLKAHITDIWIYDQLRDAGIVYVLACSSAFTNYFVHLYSLIILPFFHRQISDRAIALYIYSNEYQNILIKNKYSLISDISLFYRKPTMPMFQPE